MMLFFGDDDGVCACVSFVSSSLIMTQLQEEEQ